MCSARRARCVLASLIAENTRLTNPASAAPGDASLSDAIFNLPVWSLAKPLGVVAMLLVSVSLIVLFGGQRPAPAVILNGRAVHYETRLAPLGLNWQLSHGASAYKDYVIAGGDEIVASSALTLSFLNGAQAIAAPKAWLATVDNTRGMFLYDGALTVTTSVSSGPGFGVGSKAGRVNGRGAESSFVATVNHGTLSVTVLADMAVVTPPGDGPASLIGIGEYALLIPGLKLISGLQTPRLIMSLPGNPRLISNDPVLPFETTIAPGAQLVAIYDDLDTREFARFTADSRGHIRDSLTLPEPGRYALRFYQFDGRRRSDLSAPLSAEYAEQIYGLRVNDIKQSGNAVTLSGSTHPRNLLLINDVNVPLRMDGAFSFTFEPTPGQKTVEVSSIDSHGSKALLIQTLP